LLQTLTAVNARLSLEPSPLYATLGAAWIDGHNLYELIPYAGKSLFDYIRHKGVMVCRIEDAAADATNQRAPKEGEETPVQQVIKAMHRLESVDFTDFLVCMLLSIKQFQKQVSS
jgi:hypothetical protein